MRREGRFSDKGFIVPFLVGAMSLAGTVPMVSAATPSAAKNALAQISDTPQLAITRQESLQIHGSLEDSSANVAYAAPDFMTSATGYIATSSGLLKTTDGGTSWSKVHTPAGVVEQFSFTDVQTGYVLIATSLPTSYVQSNQNATLTLYRTENGGGKWDEVWSKKVPNSLQQGVYGLQAFGGKTGKTVVLRVSGNMYGSTNGGQTWSNLAAAKSFAHQAIVQADFVPAGNGYVVTVPWASGKSISDALGQPPAELTIWHTADGGRLWEKEAVIKHSNLTDVSLAMRGNRGVLVGWDTEKWGSYLYSTDNRGKTWTTTGKQFSQGRVFPNQPVFVTDSQVLLPMGGGAGPLASSLWESTDGGKTFHVIDGVVNWRALLLGAPFGKTIYAVSMAGNGQQLLRSSDAGKTWTQVYPSMRPTENISFVSPKVGFGLGTETNPDAVLHTTDGGASWQQVGEVPMGSQVSTLTFTSAKVGLVVEGQPRSPKLVILKTIDGGRTWNPIAGGTLPSSTDSVIASMGLIFPATLRVVSQKDWVVGATGYPKLYTFQTSNAGATWQLTTVADDPPGAVEAYAFQSATDGWMSMLATAKSGSSTPTTTMFHLAPSSAKAGGAPRQWVAMGQLPAGVGIQGMVRFGKQDGWMIGTSPWVGLKQHLVVYHTVNGGKTWTAYMSAGTVSVMTPPTLSNDYPVSFVNANDGFLLTQGALLRTTDGGKTWVNPVRQP